LAKEEEPGGLAKELEEHEWHGISNVLCRDILCQPAGVSYIWQIGQDRGNPSRNTTFVAQTYG